MDKFSERRLVENELMFRSANRKVQKQVEQDRNKFAGPDKTELQFYCECSNLRCRDRIKLTVHQYQAATTNNREFVVIKGHENATVEKVVRIEDGFTVVEKNIDPSRVLKDMSPTS